MATSRSFYFFISYEVAATSMVLHHKMFKFTRLEDQIQERESAK